MSLPSLQDGVLDLIVKQVTRRSRSTDRPPTEVLALAGTTRWLRAAVARVACRRMTWLGSSTAVSVHGWLKLASLQTKTEAICLPYDSEEYLTRLTQAASLWRLSELDLSLLELYSGDALLVLLRQLRPSLVKLSVKVEEPIVDSICAARLTKLKYFRCRLLKKDLYRSLGKILDSMQDPDAPEESALSEIYLEEVHVVEDEDDLPMDPFPLNCPNVTKFSIDGFEISLSSLAVFLSEVKDLQVLKIEEAELRLDMLRSLLISFPHLREFHFKVSDEWLGVNYAFSPPGQISEIFTLLGNKLKTLKWIGYRPLSRSQLTALAESCTQVKHLGLGFRSGSEQTLPDLCHAARDSLSFLELTFGSVGNEFPFMNPPLQLVKWQKVVPALRYLPHLQALTIVCDEFPLDHLKEILANLKDLEKFVLSAGRVREMDPEGQRLLTREQIMYSPWANPARTPLLPLIYHLAKHNHKLRVLQIGFRLGQLNLRPLPRHSPYGRALLYAIKDLEANAPDLDTADLWKLINSHVLSSPHSNALA